MAYERDRLAQSARDLVVFKRNDFQCVYCGHDGRTFEGWRHLVADHVVPRHLRVGLGKTRSSLRISHVGHVTSSRAGLRAGLRRGTLRTPRERF
jgi:5-methylcytosine-specific restriction endonuclease McrA